jgi:hypothetical protein
VLSQGGPRPLPTSAPEGITGPWTGQPFEQNMYPLTLTYYTHLARVLLNFIRMRLL